MSNKTICPNCGHEISINIEQAVDEDGKVFTCPRCGNLLITE